MRKPLKSGQPRHPNGRKNLPRDNAKLTIIKYLLSKDTDTTASLYEILHHAGISMYDYPYLKKILKEMVDSGWIRIKSFVLSLGRFFLPFSFLIWSDLRGFLIFSLL